MNVSKTIATTNIATATTHKVTDQETAAILNLATQKKLGSLISLIAKLSSTGGGVKPTANNSAALAQKNECKVQAEQEAKGKVDPGAIKLPS